MSRVSQTKSLFVCPSIVNVLVLVAVFAMCAAGSRPACGKLRADGYFDLNNNEGYSVIYKVCFPDSGRDGSASGWVGSTGVGEGLLALGTDPDSGNHFMYYAQPKGFVDNTYREDPKQSIAPVVGIYGSGVNAGGHQLGDGLIGSDNFGVDPFELYFTNPGIDPDGPLDYFRFTVDYVADVDEISSGTNPRVDIQSAGMDGDNDQLPATHTYVREDGSIGNTDNHQDLFINMATSMEWNVDKYGPASQPFGSPISPAGTTGGMRLGLISAADINDTTGYMANSPDVVRQVGGPDDGLAILAADGYSYQPANPLFPDWQYEVAYELEFHASLFGTEWANPLTDPTTLLQLPIAHASPWKGPTERQMGDPEFKVVTIATMTPEPSTLGLVALALIGLGTTRRRRRR